jgi:adenylate cyclase class 2
LAAAESAGGERAEDGMAKEREIKLRIEDLPALRRALAKLGALAVTPRLRELNVVFDTPEFDLAKREHLLRIRTETAGASRGRTSGVGARALLTFKRPVSVAGSNGKKERHKVREEIELEVSDEKALARIFEGLGMRGCFQYEKFRTTFRLPASRAWAKGLVIELDETPIGIFLELEGPAGAIDQAAQALGFETKDYILANYMVLYREHCRSRGEEPSNMLFAKKRRGAGRPESKNFS